MPRFYLHICNGSGFTEDEEGREFRDADAALEAAIHGIRDLMAEELRKGEINIASFVEIEDELRQLVRTVAFTEAVAVKSDPCARERDQPSVGSQRSPRSS
jgi:hypothetical protein